MDLNSLRQENKSDFTSDKWENGPKNSIIFQRGRDARGILCLGRLGLHPHTTIKSLRVDVNDEKRCRQPRSTVMAAGLTDHVCGLSRNPC